MYVISAEICPQDHPCPLVPACPVEAISQNGLGLPVIDQELCIGCGSCFASCPKKAVREVAGHGAL